MTEPLISDRWMAFNHIATDEIWWRYDIMIGTVMGSGLLFPANGAWHLSADIVRMLETKFASELSELRSAIKKCKPPNKLTLCGALRSHESSDHDIDTISMTTLPNIAATLGPPVGWL